MTSASSVRSSSPTKGSASAVSNENAGSGTAEKMKSQDASGSKGNLSTISATRNTNGSLTNDGSNEQLQKEHQEKLQALKQRKCDLEKLLGEKNLLLEQIQRQEQQIIAGDYEFDTGLSKTSSLNMRKKISTTSFKLPSNNKGIYGAKERSGSVGDMEKKIRQEAMNGQPHKLSTIDFNLLKSKRNMLYNDCEPAMPISQQKLMPKLQVYHDMDCVSIVAQPITIDSSPTNYHSTARNQDLLDHNKNAGMKLMNHPPMVNNNQSQRCSPVSMGGTTNCGKFIGRINSTVSSNYSMVDRRNSIKSVQQVKTSPKQQRQDDRLSMIVNSNSLRGCTSGALTMPITRSDFDLSDAMIPFSNGSNFLYDYDIPALQISAANVVYGNDLPDAGVPSSHLNSASANNRLSSVSGKANSFLNVNSKLVNYDPSLPVRMPQQEQYNQNDYDEALISHQHLMSTTSSSRKPIQMLAEVTHKRTFHNSMPGTSDGQPQPMGLGGFWKTLGKESVWCSVDKSYDSSSIQQNSTKPKKTNANMRTTPTKSISLGNFDVFNDSGSRDEMIDKISISSMNSEGNKKQKEKQWLETSLDGPSMTVATKHVQQAPPPMHNLSAGLQSLPIPVVYATSPFNNGGQQALTAQSSPVVNRLKPGSQSLLGVANAKQEDCQLLRKSSTKATRGTSYGADVLEAHPPMQGHYGRVASSASEPISLQMAQDAESITGATALAKRKSPSLTPAHLHPIQMNQPLHQQVVRGLQQKRSPALQFSSSPPQPPTILMTNNPRSPINAANLPHYDSIRIESPKNMTVVQQAVFMPYKEVTKPFEMSDFYKYSTKFRQKDKQQQQQQQQQQPPPPPQQQLPHHHHHQQNNHQPFLQKQVEVEQ